MPKIEELLCWIDSCRHYSKHILFAQHKLRRLPLVGIGEVSKALYRAEKQKASRGRLSRLPQTTDFYTFAVIPSLEPNLETS